MKLFAAVSLTLLIIYVQSFQKYVSEAGQLPIKQYIYFIHIHVKVSRDFPDAASKSQAEKRRVRLASNISN